MSAGFPKILERIRTGPVLSWAMLCVGVVVSLLLWLMLRDNIENTAEERFTHQTTEATQIIERRILSYAEVLFGAKALFATRGHVTRLEFHRFVESFELKTRFPGFAQIN